MIGVYVPQLKDIWPDGLQLRVILYCGRPALAYDLQAVFVEKSDRLKLGQRVRVSTTQLRDGYGYRDFEKAETWIPRST